MRAPSQNRVDLSIIIVHFCTIDLTLRLIESLYKRLKIVRFEIIVLDNASDDSIEDAIKQRFPRVRFLETGENTGFARANNLGIQNSHGDFILLLNSDTLITDDSLQVMLDYLQFHPEIGVIGPRQVDGMARFVPSCGHFPTLLSEIVRKIMHYRLSVDDYHLRDYIDASFANLSEVDWISGSCLMVRRKALYDAGLLDEQFFMYFEDIDFCRRIQMKGWIIRYFPSQTIVHYGGQSAKLNILNVMVENRKSQIYFSRRYYGYLGSFLVRILIFVKYGLNLWRWSFVYFLRALLGKSARYPYTMCLVAKKIMLLTFQHSITKPLVPKLVQSHAESKFIPRGSDPTRRHATTKSSGR